MSRMVWLRRSTKYSNLIKWCSFKMTTSKQLFVTTFIRIYRNWSNFSIYSIFNFPPNVYLSTLKKSHLVKTNFYSSMHIILLRSICQWWRRECFFSPSSHSFSSHSFMLHWFFFISYQEKCFMRHTNVV